MSKKRKRRLNSLPIVTFRTVSIDFDARTVRFDNGRTILVTAPCLDFPILSGNAIFLPRDGWERVA